MKRNPLSRKDLIVISAIDLINEQGIANFSTKALATKNNISEALIYKHFTSKIQILVEVLEHFSKFDRTIENSILSKDPHPSEKIIEYIRLYVEYYENYPSLSSIILNSEYFLLEPLTSQKITDINLSKLNFLNELVTNLYVVQNISPLLSSIELSHIIIGILNETILMWRIQNYSFPLKENTLKTVKAVLKYVVY